MSCLGFVWTEQELVLELFQPAIVRSILKPFRLPTSLMLRWEVNACSKQLGEIVICLHNTHVTLHFRKNHERVTPGADWGRWAKSHSLASTQALTGLAGSLLEYSGSLGLAAPEGLLGSRLQLILCEDMVMNNALSLGRVVTGLGDSRSYADLDVGPSYGTPHDRVERQCHDIGSSYTLEEAESPVDRLLGLHADRNSEVRKLLLESLHILRRHNPLGVAVEVLGDEVKDFLKFLGPDDRKFLVPSNAGDKLQIIRR